jgi:ubiquinone/menaquinone biosynthesis C-methylase UbiE
MITDFDPYAQDYRETINRVSAPAGEDYEFFIAFRCARMKRKLAQENRIGQFSILDLGCGIGAASRFLLSAFPGSTVVGVDPSASSIAIARQQELPEGNRFLQATAQEIPLPDGSIDLVYSNGIFHHMAESSWSQAFVELRRVLRPRGHIFIFENNPANPLMRRTMRQNPFDLGVDPIPPPRLAASAQSAGLTVRQTGYYFFFPHVLRFLRPMETVMEWLPMGAQYFIWAQAEGAGPASGPDSGI